VKSLEGTHVGVLGGNDLLCEAQATRWMVKLVYRAVILQLVAAADRRQYRKRDDGVHARRRHRWSVRSFVRSFVGTFDE